MKLLTFALRIFNGILWLFKIFEHNGFSPLKKFEKNNKTKINFLEGITVYITVYILKQFILSYEFFSMKRNSV